MRVVTPGCALLLSLLPVACLTPTGENKSLPTSNPSKHVAFQTLLSNPLLISMWDVIALGVVTQVRLHTINFTFQTVPPKPFISLQHSLKRYWGIVIHAEQEQMGYK